MIKTFLTNLFLIMFLGMTACSPSNMDSEQSKKEIQQATPTMAPDISEYTNIKPEEAKERMENEKGIILLDVRTIEEHTETHIPGSILIPVDDIKQKAPLVLKNKDAEIFVYCRSGRRSVTASLELVDMGYTHVYNLGGIIDWPFETETGAPKK